MADKKTDGRSTIKLTRENEVALARKKASLSPIKVSLASLANAAIKVGLPKLDKQP